MKTVEHYSFSDSRRKLDIAVSLTVTDGCECADERHQAITREALSAVSRHVERRADALRDDVEKHDVRFNGRDYEKDLDMTSPKILRCIAVAIAERIGDLCEDESGAAQPGFDKAKLDSITIEAQPIVEGQGTTFEVQVIF